MIGQAPPSIKKLPATRGLSWLSGSWNLVKKQPLRLLLISLFFQFFLSFSQVEAIGLLVILCLPVLSAGMLHAFLLVERGEKPMLSVLFIPFTNRHHISRLLLLGGVVIVLGLLVVSLILAGQVVDIDPEIITRIEQGDLDAIQLIDPQTAGPKMGAEGRGHGQGKIRADEAARQRRNDRSRGPREDDVDGSDHTAPGCEGPGGLHAVRSDRQGS